MNPDWLARLKQRHPPDADGDMSIGLIAYGSLLDPAELDVVFNRRSRTVRPVRVAGYARLFNKPVASHLRDPAETDGRGVLNLRPREDGWFNGLLVSPVRESSVNRYAFREREYELEPIPFSALSFYERKDDPAGIEPEAVYTCLLTGDPRLDEGLAPVADYLRLCREGARHWGKEFYGDFLETTLVDGTPLARVDGDEEL